MKLLWSCLILYPVVVLFLVMLHVTTRIPIDWALLLLWSFIFAGGASFLILLLGGFTDDD